MKKLFILTQTFNREWAVVNLIKNLERQTYQNYHLIIVDHGISKIKIKDNPKYTIINADSNLWWTGATNFGINYILNNCKDTTNTRVLIINDDTIFKNDFLEKAVNAINYDPEAIYGAICLDKKTKKIAYANMKLDKFKATLIYHYKGLNLESIEKRFLDTDVLKGRGILIKLDVFEKIGFYNEKLPQYRADHEFSYRAKKNGYKIYVARDMILFSELNSPNRINKKKKWLSFKKIFFDIRSTKNVRDLFIYSYLCYGPFYGTYFFIVNLTRDLFVFIRSII